MPKIKYQHLPILKNAEHLEIVKKANAIIAEYQAQGFDLTLRQLYYQFVSRGLIPNRDREYKRLGGIINDARLAGLVDWLAIVDRTRQLRSLSHWASPSSIVDACAEQYHLDLWKAQEYRPEVWIEKDALVGVIEGVCQELDVPYFSCRGYTSQSEMWIGAQRLLKYVKQGQKPVVLHFGDHDPSGIDMTRDIQDRLDLFSGGKCTLERLALNMPQIEQYTPPPNPTKLTDSRATGYLAAFGNESWELDALEPAVIAALIRDFIMNLRDQDAWDEAEQEQATHRDELKTVASQWDVAVEAAGAEG